MMDCGLCVVDFVLYHVLETGFALIGFDFRSLLCSCLGKDALIVLIGWYNFLPALGRLWFTRKFKCCSTYLFNELNLAPPKFRAAMWI